MATKAPSCLECVTTFPGPQLRLQGFPNGQGFSLPKLFGLVLSSE